MVLSIASKSARAYSMVLRRRSVVTYSSVVIYWYAASSLPCWPATTATTIIMVMSRQQTRHPIPNLNNRELIMMSQLNLGALSYFNFIFDSVELPMVSVRGVAVSPNVKAALSDLRTSNKLSVFG